MALVNSTTDTLKNQAKRHLRNLWLRERGQIEPDLVALYTTSGQETERIYSYNSGTRAYPQWELYIVSAIPLEIFLVAIILQRSKSEKLCYILLLSWKSSL